MLFTFGASDDCSPTQPCLSWGSIRDRGRCGGQQRAIILFSPNLLWPASLDHIGLFAAHILAILDFPWRRGVRGTSHPPPSSAPARSSSSTQLPDADALLLLLQCFPCSKPSSSSWGCLALCVGVYDIGRRSAAAVAVSGCCPFFCNATASIQDGSHGRQTSPSRSMTQGVKRCMQPPSRVGIARAAVRVCV